jgi:hypothetical protein
MPNFVAMRPDRRYLTPVGFLRQDAALQFVGRNADSDGTFWTDLFDAKWIETYELTADHDLVVGEDGVVRLEPAAREGRPTDMAATAEEAEFRAIDWKPNDKGIGRRMPAAYIMTRDVNAQEAYRRLRADLGLSHEEAELRIERVFDANFRTVLFYKDDEKAEDVDRRPQMWIDLGRGLSVEAIFPDLEELGMRDLRRPLQ